MGARAELEPREALAAMAVPVATEGPVPSAGQGRLAAKAETEPTAPPERRVATEATEETAMVVRYSPRQVPFRSKEARFKATRPPADRAGLAELAERAALEVPEAWEPWEEWEEKASSENRLMAEMAETPALLVTEAMARTGAMAVMAAAAAKARAAAFT